MDWLRSILRPATAPPVVHPDAIDRLEQELDRMEHLIRRYRLPVAVETDHVFTPKDTDADVE